MKKFFHLFLFFLAFQMEVRVRASAAVLEQPKNCLKAKEVCALRATPAGFHLENKDIKIHATGGSALIRFSPQEWRLVQGTLWVEEGAKVKVETLYGLAEAKFGQYWLIEKDDKVWVRNISASLKMTLKDGKVLNVPEGFEFWIAGIGSHGQTEFGMIQPITISKHLPLWNTLYRGTKENFIKEVKHLHENWGDLSAKSSAVYRAVVDREIAAEKAEEAEQARRKARAAAQTQEIKRLYHEKVFLR